MWCVICDEPGRLGHTYDVFLHFHTCFLEKNIPALKENKLYECRLVVESFLEDILKILDIPDIRLSGMFTTGYQSKFFS